MEESERMEASRGGGAKEEYEDLPGDKGDSKLD
jgi:hypothetical protein